MELFKACYAFSSLSQETRLKVFKLLIEYGDTGAMPSKLAEELNVPDNTLSFHLSHLTKSGLVSSRREGRTVLYVANCSLVEDLIDYLRENCCAREPNNSSNCKPAKKRSKKS